MIIPPSEPAARRLLLLGWLVPAAVLLSLTAVVRIYDLDVAVSRLFYGGNHNWPLYCRQPWYGLYRFGELPAIAMAVTGTAIALAPLKCDFAKGQGKYGWFLLLLVVLGPGILVNGVLKPVFSRPRPSEIVSFQGCHEFTPVGRISRAEETRSFPSGHAAMGFAIGAPAFFLFGRRRAWAICFVLMGLAGGTIVGLGRIIQGSHFLSDILWSAGVVYFAGAALCSVFGFWKVPATAPLADEVPDPAQTSPTILLHTPEADSSPVELPMQETKRTAA